MIFDLGLLVLFVLLVSLFLHKKKKNITKEGLLWLYHTSWGLKVIKKTGEKYKKTIKFASYISVYLGYLLMIAMLWMFGRIVWLYAFHGDIVRAIKLPPIMPLIPYLPQIFKLSFLPPFYFSYWIIILAIIAITHELFHGIFAAADNVETKTTGFGFFPFFFPIFLAAFVNLDEKAMEKRKNFSQRAVLSAGTFANSITAILGVILMAVFFTATFSPVGVVYDSYAYGVTNITDITEINGVPVDWSNLNISEFNSTEFSQIKVGDEMFYGVKAFDFNKGLVALYYNAPAINANISGAISKIGTEKIISMEKLTEVISSYSVGETVTIETYDGNEFSEVEIVFGENPEKENTAWIGVTFKIKDTSSFISKFASATTFYKGDNVYYAPDWEFAQFIYDFLWWLVLISFSVALVNMLPMGIFDGGRFFYLTVLAVTKSKKIAETGFKWFTQFLLFALFVVMFFWAKNLFL